jgi:hypothetical protein
MKREIPWKTKQKETKGDWSFNSPFVLWLLSTFVVGLGSFAFTQWHDYSTRMHDRERTIERLDTEISFRIDQYSDTDYEESHTDFSRIPPKPLFELFPEYHARTLRSLLVELRSLVPEDIEKQCITLAMDELSLIGKLEGSEPLNDTVHLQWMELIGSFRWSPSLQPDVDSAIEFMGSTPGFTAARKLLDSKAPLNKTGENVVRLWTTMTKILETTEGTGRSRLIACKKDADVRGRRISGMSADDVELRKAAFAETIRSFRFIDTLDLGVSGQTPSEKAPLPSTPKGATP